MEQGRMGALGALHPLASKTSPGKEENGVKWKNPTPPAGEGTGPPPPEAGPPRPCGKNHRAAFLGNWPGTLSNARRDTGTQRGHFTTGRAIKATGVAPTPCSPPGGPRCGDKMSKASPGGVGGVRALFQVVGGLRTFRGIRFISTPGPGRAKPSRLGFSPGGERGFLLEEVPDHQRGSWTSNTVL